MSSNLEIMALIIKMDYTRLVGWSPAGSKIYHLPYRHTSRKVYEKKSDARVQKTPRLLSEIFRRTVRRKDCGHACPYLRQ